MRFGPYETLARLGEGGMGEVYRARDPRLQRDVAIKVLRGEAVRSAERRTRFETEARAASALNHPNILTIHDIGDHEGAPFMVTELIEGETLRTLLSDGPLPVKRLLDIAVQISSGLAAAHGAGITHRDLKPDNVMVTRDGHVKILDFGLAKLSQPAPDEATLTAVTDPGTVMGTAAYMSPEQARGAGVDFRSDQFSLGVLLHEMTTGRQTFRRATNAESMTAILREDAPPLDPSYPAPLRWIVERLLAKSPEDRYESTKDVYRDLRTLREHLAEAAPGPLTAAAEPVAARTRTARPWAAVALAGALGTGGIVGWLARAPQEAPPPEVVRFTIPADNPNFPMISPDGRHVAYLAGPASSLFIQDLDKAEPREIAGVSGPLRPFWSPDSKWLAFNSGQDLMKIPVTGGPPTIICKLPSPEFFSGAWSPDGELIVFGSRPDLYQVPARGGTPQKIISAADNAPVGPRDPSFLPIAGRRVILYCDGTGGGIQVRVRDLDRTESRTLRLSGQFPIYTRSGFVAVTRPTREQSLWAVPFSLDKLEETGEPFAAGNADFVASVSANETLAYVDPGGSAERQLVVRDRTGTKAGVAGSPLRGLAAPAISPDGTRVAASGAGDIWIHEVGRPARTRLTSHPEFDSQPVWSPGGDRVVFSSRRESERSALLVIASDGSSPEKRLHGGQAMNLAATDWGRSGTLLFTVRPTPYETTLSSIREDQAQTATRVSPPGTQINETDGRLSPDERFLAYTSSESGSNEVYLRRFPDGTGKRQVSTNGGSQPRWRRDGREIFYRHGRALFAVPVIPGAEPKLGTPVQLFQLPPSSAFDVFPDGQRFVTTEALEEAKPRTLRIVQNWAAEFRDRLVSRK